jgi:hypothetical protein
LSASISCIFVGFPIDVSWVFVLDTDGPLAHRYLLGHYFTVAVALAAGTTVDKGASISGILEYVQDTPDAGFAPD